MSTPEYAALVAQHPDAPLFASFGGVAPVTVQSGKSRQVNMRRACPRFLRQKFHEFARCPLKTSRWALAYYELLRAKGHKFHSAVRALAYKWLRILFRCWQTNTPYHEARHLQRLQQQQHSPLLKFLPNPKTNGNT